jgi:multicomponent Na+:H+ antiporter subunit C
MLLEICVLVTILLGFLGLLYKRNLIMKVIAMDVMSTGVIAYYVVTAARGGVFTPILLPDRPVAYADPVPQAVILTAIVIGLSIQALMLVGVMKLSRSHPTLEVRDIEMKNFP